MFKLGDRVNWTIYHDRVLYRRREVYRGSVVEVVQAGDLPTFDQSEHPGVDHCNRRPHASYVVKTRHGLLRPNIELLSGD